jgi:ribosome maturation factor RimP
MAGTLSPELRARIETHVESLGFECVQVTFAVESGRRILRVMLDAPGSVRLDQCAQVSRALEPLLESEQELARGYTLEVSSPGINRPLTKPEHFRRFRGETVQLRLREKLDGGQTVTGVLGTLDGEVLTVETSHGARRVPLGLIARARLQRDLDRVLKAGRGRFAR